MKTKEENKPKINQNNEIKIEPAFLQKIGNKKIDSEKKINNKQSENKENEEDEFDENDFNFDYDSSSDEELNENDEKNEVLKCEGYLYKYIDKKMRKLYFKLIYKDLYYFKNKEDKSHKGMHNLIMNIEKEEDQF